MMSSFFSTSEWYFSWVWNSKLTFFSLRTLKIVTYVLASVCADEKPICHLIIISVRAISIFSLWKLWNIFSFSSMSEFHYNMSGGKHAFIYSSQDSVWFFHLWTYSLFQLLAFITSNITFLPHCLYPFLLKLLNLLLYVGSSYSIL